MIPFLQSVANLNAGLSFELPLSDAGAGIASLVPLSSLGSATPTYTRASSAYARLSNGVWSLISTGQPRSMYSAAGVYLGYWSEGARADVLGSTAAIRRTMSDAGWVVGATMTVGTSVGVDGVAAACALLTGGAVAATNTILFTTVLGSAARTYSIRVRRVTGTSPVNITDNGGTNWTVMSTTATEQLFQVTRTQANPVVGVQVEGNGDQVAVDFNTIEAATFANPTPIPVNVSKASDVLTYPSAGNISDVAGTGYAEISVGLPSGTSSSGMFVCNSGNGSVGQLFFFSAATTTIGIRDSVGNSASKTGLTDAATGMRKRASSWATGRLTATGDGASVATTAAYSGTFGGAVLGIGNFGGDSNQPYGSIRNLRIYNRALSAAQLQVLTA